MSTFFKIEGFVDCKIVAKGPVLYFLRNFDEEYEIFSLYWKIQINGISFLIDTGIKDVEYINSTVKSGGKWERVNSIELLNDIDFIFPTHFHYDHCSFLYDYREVKIIINEKTFMNLFNDEYEPIFSDKIYNKEIIEKIKNKNNIFLFRDGEEIVTGVKTYWVGGHTPCSQIIVFNPYYENADKKKKKIIFGGDIVPTFKNIEEKIPGGFNYNLIDFFKFYKRFPKEDYVIIPGHDINAYNLFKNFEIDN